MKKGFIASYVSLLFTSMIFSGCGGKVWVMPKPIEPIVIDKTKYPSLSDEDIVSIFKANIKEKIEAKSYRDQYDYNYRVYLVADNAAKENITVKEDIDGSCGALKKTLEKCQEWDFYKPEDSFLNLIGSNQYFLKNKFLAVLGNANEIKLKIGACQNTIGLPKIYFDDHTKILGNKANEILSPSLVEHIGKGVAEYSRLETNQFNCLSLKDTYKYKPNDRFIINHEKAGLTFNASELKKDQFVCKIYSIKYRFIPEIYKVEDKFISVSLTVKEGYYSEKAQVALKVNNLTDEYIEIENISIYLGGNIYDYLEKGSKNIDLSPSTALNIKSNRHINDSMPHMYQPIGSLSDTYKIGIAVKYKIMSTNTIRTLFKTDNSKIVFK